MSEKAEEYASKYTMSKKAIAVIAFDAGRIEGRREALEEAMNLIREKATPVFPNGAPLPWISVLGIGETIDQLKGGDK